MRLRYDEKILEVDQQISQLIDIIKQLGFYDNSLIIITADHGQNFVSGYQAHNTPVLAAAEHAIPLLVKFPHQTEGQRVKGLASHVDIFPTIMEVLKVRYLHNWIDGQPLQQIGINPDRVIFTRIPNPYPTSGEDTVAALFKDWKLISRKAGKSLFNLANDPDEKVDLFGKVELKKINYAYNQFVHRMKYLRGGADILKLSENLDN